ncbi:hypothetical protein [uncultured Draconibacterium sp.]|uniref:hypothetical protein n=1 Tax=uncultured Draconibacterium sp. TaxID=1573823 RepID=UPI0025DF6228|nr:hypothetical protein [uncultured Draconibacterium sp.]
MTYTVKDNQTITDLAIQLYGTVEAVERLLTLNPQLTGRDPAWNITDSLTPGSVIYYDEEESNKNVLKELDGKTIISE